MGFFSSLSNQIGDAQGVPPAEMDNFAPGSNYRQAPGQRPGVEIGSPGGMMPPQNLADIGQQTQQMANNPVYGQSSPFQPPQQPIGGNFFDALSKSLGMPQNTQPNNSIPNPGIVGSGGGKMMGDLQAQPPMLNSVGGMMGGKMGAIMDASAKAQNRGQLVGGPVDKPIFGGGTPMQPPSNMVTEDIFGNQPLAQNRGQLVGGAVDKPIFRGGLRPAPRNYRAPRGNLRSFTRR